MVCVTYVDDCLFFAPNSANIDNMIQALCDDNYTLEIEDEVAGYLGVHLKHNDDKPIPLTQTGLIDRIIKAAGLEGANHSATPAEADPLGSDKDGIPYSGTFSYASLVGMLKYLAGHSRPDIAFSVHQCARFTFAPKASHAEALKRIVRYLIGTKDKGYTLRQPDNINVDCYVDADFAGLWSSENRLDSSSVKSRTGFIILMGGAPISWFSKLQTEIALSTFEAEYVALSTSMHELLPFLDILVEVYSGVSFKLSISTTIKSTVWEDNAACEKLANMVHPHVTPRSKHFGIKYHWFCEKLVHRNISVEHIDTKLQLADIFTKGLRSLPFQTLRKLIMGW